MKRLGISTLVSHRKASSVVAMVIVLFAVAQVAQAGVLVDLRPTGATGGFVLEGGKNVTYNGGAGTITIDVWAKVSGANGTLTDDQIQSVGGSFASANYGGGVVKGNLVSSITTPFQSGVENTAWFTGNRGADVDGDGDIDVGAAVAGSGATAGMPGASATDTNNNNWFKPRAAALITSANALTNGFIAGQTFNDLGAAGFEVKLGSLTFTQTDAMPVVAGAETAIQWWGRPKSASLTDVGAMKVDNVNYPAYVAADIQSVQSTGAVSITTPVPEPATIAMTLVAMLCGLVVWGRRS